MLARLDKGLRGLELHSERMRANLDGGGLMMPEAVMLDLGKTIGHQHALWPKCWRSPEWLGWFFSGAL